MRSFRAPAVILTLSTLTSALLVDAAQDRQVRPPLVVHSMLGSDLYKFYCASCHGAGGRGDGPVAQTLKSDPPDLSRLALRNGGVFPRARVEATIEGRSDPPLPVHGTREMPVWGPIFRGLDANDAANRTRIGNLVDYLQSLQLKNASLRHRNDASTAGAVLSEDCRVNNERTAEEIGGSESRGDRARCRLRVGQVSH